MRMRRMKLMRFISLVVLFTIIDTNYFLYASDNIFCDFEKTENEIELEYGRIGVCNLFVIEEKKADSLLYSANCKNEEIDCYILDNKNMKQFIENPNEEFLKTAFNKQMEEACVLRVSDKFDKAYGDDLTIYAVVLNDNRFDIKCEFLTPETKDITYFFTRKIIKNISTLNLQKQLQDKGINEKIVNKAVICNKYYPSIIWIKTENNIYFWVFEGITYGDDTIGFKNIDNKVDDSYTIKSSLYSYEEFYKKYSEQSGNIIANDVVIKDSVLFYGADYVVKVRSLLEALGAKDIIWSQEKKSITFYLDGDKIEYYLNVDSNRVYYSDVTGKYSTRIFINDMPSLDDAWWNNRAFYIGNSLYFNSDYLHMLFRKYNNDIDVDMENRTLTITKK